MNTDIDPEKASELFEDERIDASTVRLWKFIDDNFSESLDNNPEEIKQPLNTAREYARDSSHFLDIVNERPSLDDYEFISQIESYLDTAEQERQKRLKQLFHDIEQELKEANDVIRETNEAIEELNEKGLF